MCVVEAIAIVLTLLGAAYWAAGIFLPYEGEDDTVEGKTRTDKRNNREIRLTKRP